MCKSYGLKFIGIYNKAAVIPQQPSPYSAEYEGDLIDCRGGCTTTTEIYTTTTETDSTAPTTTEEDQRIRSETTTDLPDTTETESTTNEWTTTTEQPWMEEQPEITLPLLIVPYPQEPEIIQVVLNIDADDSLEKVDDVAEAGDKTSNTENKKNEQVFDLDTESSDQNTGVIEAAQTEDRDENTLLHMADTDGKPLPQLMILNTENEEEKEVIAVDPSFIRRDEDNEEFIAQVSNNRDDTVPESVFGIEKVVDSVSKKIPFPVSDFSSFF